MEGCRLSVDHAADAVLDGFRDVLAVEFGGPPGGGFGSVQVEESGAEDVGRIDQAVDGGDLTGARVEAGDQRPDGVGLGRVDEGGLADDDDVSEFDLIDE